MSHEALVRLIQKLRIDLWELERTANTSEVRNKVRKVTQAIIELQLEEWPLPFVRYPTQEQCVPVPTAPFPPEQPVPVPPGLYTYPGIGVGFGGSKPV